MLVPLDFVPNLRVILRGQGLTTMISLCDANGLGDLLNDPTTNHTIFAPTNAAFAAAPPASLNANTVAYHISDDFEPLSSYYDGELEPSHLLLPLLLNQPQMLKVGVSSNNSITVNNVTLVSGNYFATNGVVHILASVLTPPPTLATLLQNATGLANFTSFLNASGLLSGAVNTSAGLTVFAPTNMAFSQVNPQVLRYLNAPLALPVLQNILSYHIIDGTAQTPQTIFYRDVVPMGVTNITMMSGEVAMLNKAGTTSLTINNQGSVVYFNALGANGVLHVVNSVLLPPSFVFDLQKALVGVNATSFLTAFLNSSLAPLLNGVANFTIFAPSNAAVAAYAATQPNMSAAALLPLLQYHVLPGIYMTNSLTNAQVLPTLLYPSGLSGSAQVLRVNISSTTSIYVNNANITMANNTAVNGVVHVIDRVLVPPMSIGTILATNPAFSTFNALLQASGLAGLVQGRISLSLFFLQRLRI